MVTLVLVRSVADLSFAVRSVNEFLAYRRSRDGVRESDEVLAVCLRADLDFGLPLWPFAPHEPAPPRGGAAAASERADLDEGIGIVESISLSGIWTVCRLAGRRLETARDAAARRDAVLRFLAALPLPGAVFFPVFDMDEPVESVEAQMRDLQRRHPALVGSGWFRDHEADGIVDMAPV